MKCAAAGAQVVVPGTFHELTSRRVLTSEWVDGEKLSQSMASDVGDLVNVGVISYLKQLLDTGFFHVPPPPHPFFPKFHRPITGSCFCVILQRKCCLCLEVSFVCSAIAQSWP